MDARNLLKEAFAEALRAADPAVIVPPHLPPLPPGRLVVVGAGKAAAAMALAVETHYPDADVSGLVVTRYGHSLPTQKIRVVEAAHPVPDAAGEAAAQEILELSSGLSEDDLLLCLISGGGSALLAAPEGVSLTRKADLTRALLRSGADIVEINTLRKHLSRIKGGGLARAAAPARVLTLMISDVSGDDPSSIASGPTVPDPSTFGDALEILDRYHLDFSDVRAYLSRGKRGLIAETPKTHERFFNRVENRVIANAQGVLEAAARFFEAQGFAAHILSDSLTGEAREAAKTQAALVRQITRYEQPFRTPCVLLSGGETTVTVKQPGRGGRNTEFLLSLAIELDGLEGVYALAADTDGIDGSEDAAGAVIGAKSLQPLGKREARGYLERNDSYSFFERTGELLLTGPTLTNVNDLRMVLLR